MKLFIAVVLLFVVSNPILGQEKAQNNTNIEQPQMTSIAEISIDGMACQEGCADKISFNLPMFTP